VFAAGSVHAQAPAPAAAAPAVSGNTLWHWLGIPQGYNKVRDARVNRSGDNPDRERLPPLKRIADPANLYSQNPAIAAAAKIKSEEDLAPQKIKAIKYLGTVGCGCYEGVREALLAALGDCTEEVRYEAAIALCQVAGNPCKHCDGTGCCNAAVMNKLNDMAYGQDAKGCCKEPSERVRQAAANALNACRRKNPTTPMVPVPDDHPTIKIKDKDILDEPQQEPKAAPTGQNDRVPTPAPMPPATLQFSSTASVQPTSYSRSEGFAEASDSTRGEAIATSNSNAAEIAQQVAFLRFGDRGRRNYVPCPQQQICPEQTQAAAPGETTKPGETPAPSPSEPSPSELAAGEPAVPPSNALASNYGATSGPLSSAPNMIGDSNAGGCGGLTFMGIQTLAVQHPIFACSRMNISENNKADVENRVYFQYRHYEGSNLMDIFGLTDPSRVKLFDLDQYMLGFEKTIGDNTSIEFRLPINRGMGNDLSFSDNNGVYSLPFNETTSVGNLGIILKRALYRTQKFYFSGGVAVNTPTAPSLTMRGNVNDSAFPVVNPITLQPITTVNALMNFEGHVNNDTVNLMPFLAARWTNGDDWFANGFCQLDVPLNSNRVSLYEDLTIDGRTQPTIDESSTLAEQTLLRLNAGVGRWVYRNDDPHRMINGIASVFEVHYTATLQDAQLIGPFPVVDPNLISGLPATNLTVGNLKNRMDVVNAVLGVPILMGKTTVYNGFVVPVTTGDNRGFSFEYAFMLDRHF
jgi:hypothetical protein